MKTLTLFLLLTFSSAIVSSNPSDLPTLTELCDQEPQFCKQVLDSRGQPLPIAPAIKRFVEEARDAFIDAGEKYGVDPRAAMGAVAAEHTMNVQFSDEVQDWLAYRGITNAPDADLKPRQFTFGPGQINMPAALEAEQHLAKIDGRPERSAAEIREALLTLEGSAYYATGIVRKAQDAYKDKGIDISNRPEILASVYNMGNSERRAADAAASRRKPKANYFGYFVAKNLDEITQLMGWDPSNKKRTKPRVSEELSKRSGTFSVLNPGVQLLTSPPSCSLDGRADAGRYSSIMTRREYPSQGLATGLFKVVGRGVDCDLKDYVFVQFENGKSGWLSATSLNDNYGFIRPSGWPMDMWCSSEETKACLERIKSLVGNSVPESGQIKAGNFNDVIISLPTTDGKALAASFKKNSLGDCSQENGIINVQTTNSKVTPDVIDKLDRKIAEIKEQVIKRFALESWTDPANPISSNAFGDLSYCRDHMNTCNIQYSNVKPFRGGSGYSMLGTLSLDSFLNLDVTKMDSRDLVLFLNSHSLSSWTSSSDSSLTLDEYKNRVHQAITNAKKDCQPILAEVDGTRDLEEIEQMSDGFTDKTFKNAGSNTQNWLKEIESYPEKCAAIPRVLKEDIAGIEDVFLDVAANSTSSLMKVKSIAKIQPGKAALLSGFGGSIKELTQEMRSYSPKQDQFRCTYDPFQAASLVQKLSLESCVSQILVPDRFILVSQKGEGAKKVVFLDSDDRHFQVNIKGCQRKGGSVNDIIKATK